jgi:hypothetical protein
MWTDAQSNGGGSIAGGDTLTHRATTMNMETLTRGGMNFHN